MHVTTMARVVMMVAVSLLAAACSGSETTVTPSPTPVPAPAPSPAPPATLTGVVTNESGARLSALVQVTEGTGRGRSVNTNAEGAYTLPDVGPGALTVRAASKGYRDQFVPVVALGPTSLDFRMQLLPKGVLSGTVSDADTGAPIAGATVTILRDLTTDVVDDWGRTATTDSGGVYRFDNMTIGGVNIAGVAPGYQEWRTGGNLNVRPTFDLALRRVPSPETFTGRISWVDQTGCVHPPPGPFTLSQHPCVFHRIDIRRAFGNMTVSVTWEGAADNDIEVHLFHAFGGLQTRRGAAGAGRTISFSQFPFWSGTWTVAIIDMGNPIRSGTAPTSTRAVPYRLTVTRWD